MKYFAIGFLLLVFTNYVFAAKTTVVPLSTVLQPHAMSVDKNHLYICENAHVSIYSLKDFQLIKRFGKKGEGPEEFKSAVTVNCQTDRLIINSVGKVSFFTKEGDYISEVKVSPQVFFGFLPIDDGFVAAESFPGRNFKVNLYNTSLEKEKTFFEDNNPRKFGSILDKTYIVKVSGKKIFIVATNDFIIDVFYKNGKKLLSIRQNYKLLEFTKEHERGFLESYKNNPVTREFYENFKKIAKFPGSFPAIDDLFVTDGKVYVQTYKVVDNNTEFYIFEESGKFLRTVFLPVVEKFFDQAVFNINNGKLYLLVENESEEDWEIHITEIE